MLIPLMANELVVCCRLRWAPCLAEGRGSGVPVVPWEPGPACWRRAAAGAVPQPFSAGELR